MIEVQLRDRIVSRSRNLRGMRDYARVSPVVRVECRKCDGRPWRVGGTLRVTYADGATCETEFASYNIMVDFVRKRRSWRGADFRYLDGNVGYLTSPGIIAG